MGQHFLWQFLRNCSKSIFRTVVSVSLPAIAKLGASVGVNQNADSMRNLDFGLPQIEFSRAVCARYEHDLHVAIAGGEVDHVRNLLPICITCSWHFRNLHTLTTVALWGAIYSRHDAIVHILLDETTAGGAPKLNLVDPTWGDSSLLAAAKFGNAAIVGALLQKGADVTQTDRMGYTALMNAAKNGSDSMVLVMLAHCGDSAMTVVNFCDNDIGSSPLILASWRGHVSTADILLRNGARVDQANKMGKSPLIFATSRGQTAVVQLLLKHGANVNLFDNEGKSALLLAAEYGYQDVMAALIEAEGGCNINQSDKTGNTALMFAAENGDLGSVVDLVKATANVKQVDKQGRSALYFAAANGHLHVIRYLLHAGAEVNQQSEYENTILMVATQAATMLFETVFTLVQAGARVNDRNSLGWSALTYAISQGNKSTVKFLVEDHDATIQAADIAEAENHAEVRLYLQQIKLKKKSSAKKIVSERLQKISGRTSRKSTSVKRVDQVSIEQNNDVRSQTWRGKSFLRLSVIPKCTQRIVNRPPSGSGPSGRGDFSRDSSSSGISNHDLSTTASPDSTKLREPVSFLKKIPVVPFLSGRTAIRVM